MSPNPILRYHALTGTLEVILHTAAEAQTLRVTDGFYVRRAGLVVVGVVVDHLADFEDYGLLELYAGQDVAGAVAEAQRQHGA